MSNEMKSGDVGQLDRHSSSLERLGLAETIAAIRDQLTAAAAAGSSSGIQFPVQGVVLEFNVAIERTVDAKSGVRIWVVEIGASGNYRKQEIQKITVSLGTPVDRQGIPVKVTRGLGDRP